MLVGVERHPFAQLHGEHGEVGTDGAVEDRNEEAADHKEAAAYEAMITWGPGLVSMGVTWGPGLLVSTGVTWGSHGAQGGWVLSKHGTARAQPAEEERKWRQVEVEGRSVEKNRPLTPDQHQGQGGASHLKGGRREEGCGMRDVGVGRTCGKDVWEGRVGRTCGKDVSLSIFPHP